MDLNTVRIPTPEGKAPAELTDYSVIDTDRAVQAYFKNLTEHLIQHIHEADMVLGCVAWLTKLDILEALAQKQYVSIIVQKEDFLKPDLDGSDHFKQDLARGYGKLKCNISRCEFGNSLRGMSYLGGPSVDPVRCVGYRNSPRTSSSPRMHNKFLVFAKVATYKPPHCSEQHEILPYAVWTGSFNLSKNAAHSFENAVVLTDPVIVAAYFQEFGQIAALSEKLDWSCEWIALEWRMGS